MKTIEIKGKEYVLVNERLLYFRENYKKHKIVTEIISLENGICVMKAMILDDSNEVISMGHAYEKEGSTFINKTSYIENCETSAIGRALGMLGIGIETSIASAEEVGNAVNNQSKGQPTKQKEETTSKQSFKSFSEDNDINNFIDNKEWPEIKKNTMKKQAANDPVIRKNILNGVIK